MGRRGSVSKLFYIINVYFYNAVTNLCVTNQFLGKFFLLPSPKAGRELQTVLNTRENEDEDEDP